MKIKKKLRIRHLLLLILMTAFIPGLRAYDFESDGIYYTILSEEDRTVEVSGAPKETVMVEIPETVKDEPTDISYTVTAIGEKSFRNSSVTTVDLPETLQIIKEDAFMSCSNLSSIRIPDSVLIIESSAFMSVGFSSKDEFELKLGKSLKYIGSYNFYESYIKGDLILPDSLEYIGSHSFQHTEYLTSVYVPASVSYIGNGVFSGCLTLNEINVSLENEKYASIDGVLYDKDIRLLVAFPGQKKSIIIPPGVEEIGNEAFYCCGNVSISFPPSLKKIDYRAFCSSGVRDINIPEGVREIGDSAFAECRRLESVVLPSTIDTLDWGTFYWCSSLSRVTCYSIEPPICYAAFGNTNRTGNRWDDEDLTPIDEAILYVPEESIGLYREATTWREFKEILPIEEAGIDALEAETRFYRVYNLNGVNIFNTTEKSEINNLPAGLYIINGKKVMIK